MTAELPDSFPSPVPEYLRLAFPEPPADRPYVILNMVASADGKAVAGSTESSLSSPTDKLVLQSLRVHVDAILNGAGTARATGVNPQIRDPRLSRRRAELGRPGPPLQALLTRTGDLSPDAPFFHRNDFQLVLFVSGPADPLRLEALRATGRPVELIPPASGGLRRMMQRLRSAYRIRLLLLEGGPTLNAELFHAGLVDELFLTVGPHIVGGRATMTPVEGEPFAPDAMPSLELLSAYPSLSTSEVYLRWRVRPPSPDSESGFG